MKTCSNPSKNFQELITMKNKMFGKRTYRSRDLIGSIILWSFQRLAACLHESGIWSRILCNFDRDSPYNIRLLIWAIDVRLLCPYVIVPYHVLFSVLFLLFDIIIFYLFALHVWHIIKTWRLLHYLRIWIYLYFCIVVFTGIYLSVCLSGEGILLMIMNVEYMDCVRNVCLTVCT